MAQPKRWALMALFVIAVMFKIPGLWPNGRLWAEDGFFLRDALNLSAWQALTAIHTGYIDVTSGAAMLIAAQAPLEHVALLSVLAALAIQICPAILLLHNRCRWLQAPEIASIGLLLILTPPVSEEVWLSPVTSQYHLMLCCALILALPTGIGKLLGFQVGILALAGLSGPGPALLAPLFIIRTCLERTPQRFIQTLVLSIGALIELAIFATHPEPDRHLTIEFPLLLSVIGLKHVILPLFGRYNMYQMHTYEGILRLAAIVGSIWLGIMVVRTRDRTVSWLFIAAITLMGLSYFGALGTKTDLLSVYFGQRYYYAPQVLVGLALLGGATSGSKWAGFFVVWLLAMGLTEYTRINPMVAQGPSWRDEITEWRHDPSYAVTLWPPSFQIKLR